MSCKTLDPNFFTGLKSSGYGECNKVIISFSFLEFMFSEEKHANKLHWVVTDSLKINKRGLWNSVRRCVEEG